MSTSILVLNSVRSRSILWLSNIKERDYLFVQMFVPVLKSKCSNTHILSATVGGLFRRLRSQSPGSKAGHELAQGGYCASKASSVSADAESLRAVLLPLSPIEKEYSSAGAGFYLHNYGMQLLPSWLSTRSQNSPILALP